MPGRHLAKGPEKARPFSRAQLFAVLAVMAFAMPFPALVNAQPSIPKLDVPKVPTIPSAPKLDIPKAPAMPSAPALPKAPTLPGAAPAAAAPGAAAPAAAAPAASGSAAAAPAAAPSALVTDDPDDPANDVDIILKDQKPKAGEDGLPATLPRELRKNAPKDDLNVQDRKEGALTIEEVVNSPIVSASNRLENVQSAPAYVIVLTAKDLRDRGYTDLSQALDDLPGMDVIRPYGDIYFKSYWRGYRPGSGADPYLIMIDGIQYNQLFFGDGQIFASFPISNVERLEIVYGPASAVYGPNAAMGVINVITTDSRQRKQVEEWGAKLESRITYGGAQRNLSRFQDSTKIADATATFLTKDFRLRLTARIEESVLDRSIGDDFEYTKPAYYASPDLWGRSVLDAYPFMGGQFLSADRKRAVDMRLTLGNTEFGAQYFNTQTGYGVLYPADRQQTQGTWTSSELSLFGRHVANLSPSVVSSTLLQFRRSDITSPSSWISRGRTGSTFDENGAKVEAVEAPSQEFVVQQNFDTDLSRNLFMEGDQVKVAFGLKYEHMILAKTYRSTSRLVYTYDSPITEVRNDTDASNATNDGRLDVPADQLGAHILGKYAFPTANAIHMGLRLDSIRLSNSLNATVRGGYVGTFDKLTMKLLYGQAVYSPSTYDRALATTTLEDEKSQTIEGNVSFTFWKLALNANVWFVDYTNPIVGGVNVPNRNVMGADFGARLLIRPLQVWAYYSRYIFAKESDGTGGTRRIGDLAFDKIWAGATFDKGPVAATLLARIIGPKDPVLTNPVGEVPLYVVLDANVVLSHVIHDGLWFGFRITNIFDSGYEHPGMLTAGSGGQPGYWNGNVYTGSLDGYNSRMPQPRRGLYLTMGLDL